MQSLMVLGRQPKLGLAELESLYGADKLTILTDHTVIVDIDPCLLAFDRLGGSIKFCKIVSSLPIGNWADVEKFLIKAAPEHSKMLPEGKLLLGLSAIGFDISPRQIEATGLGIKKAVRKTGRSVRLVPNKTLELNSAQVMHNKLTGPNGWELVIIKHDQAITIAQSVRVQDIDSYTLRDRGRPKRDTRIGMLPPKLAQIIINLAAGLVTEESLSSICDIPAGEPIPPKILKSNLLDPFCGTGVILQEALLMGYSAFGTDKDPKMVSYSTTNVLEWLPSRHKYEGEVNVALADATVAEWSDLPSIDLVASETYLGRTFTSPPSGEILAQTVTDCNLIIKKFLNNIHGQLKPGTRLCLAVPAWQIRRNQFKHLPLIDQINNLGYNRVVLEQVDWQDLLYFREDQIVARELLIITRN